MKAVLISIQPKWCEMIASGKKTVEVRKTKPKLETPFKCYIYCTHNNRKYALHTYINSGYGRKNFGVIGNWRSGKDVVDVNSHLPAYRYNAYLAEGKVIGEFVCDKVDEYRYGVYDGEFSYHIPTVEGEKTCLEYTEAEEYGNGKPLYFWHISDLVIYDKPKDLSEFYQEGKNGEKFYYDYCAGCPHHETPVGDDPCNGCDGNRNYFYRPPQSWFYVEEVRQ